MATHDLERGAAVRAVVEGHGLNARSQRNRTGINHVTMGNMMAGYPVDMTTVVRFAQGFRLDLNEWLERYDFPSVRTGAEILGQGIYDLQQKYDRPHITLRNFVGRERLTPEEAAKYLEALEEDVLKEIEEEKRTGGRPPRPHGF